MVKTIGKVVFLEPLFDRVSTYDPELGWISNDIEGKEMTTPPFDQEVELKEGKIETLLRLDRVAFVLSVVALVLALTAILLAVIAM